MVLCVGDAQTVLSGMPSSSIDACVTSPPYWGLRDYGVPATVWGGDSSCSHVWGDWERGRRKDLFPIDRTTVGRIGPNSYTSGGRPSRDQGTVGMHGSQGGMNRMAVPSGLKPKDLVGIPWRVAFALQADGWYLRSDIVWAKPNALPESVRDRPSRNHEYLFLLARSERYFYDSVAIQEPCQSGPSDIRKMLESLPRIGGKHKLLRDPLAKASAATNLGQRRAVGHPDGRNRRTVWTVATAPYHGAHFATFPPALVEPCIRASTSERGCCARCGAPWQRDALVSYRNPGQRTTNGPRSLARRHETAGFSVRLAKQITTVGWRPTCACQVGRTIPSTVLDPFAGSGTTMMVARSLGRHAVGIELNREYQPLIRERCAAPAGNPCAA